MITRRLLSGLATSTLAATAFGAVPAAAEDPVAATATETPPAAPPAAPTPDPAPVPPSPAAPATSAPAGPLAPTTPGAEPLGPVAQTPQATSGTAERPARTTPVPSHRPAGDDGQAKPATAKDETQDTASGTSAPDPRGELALDQPAPEAVPGVLLRNFRIPPFLLSIYQAAGVQYGIRWEILAAINEIETDYGRNIDVSSAGAEGWMQFMPATWAQYGVDANRDGQRDPYNPVDAIFAAARYLRAAGAAQDIRRAIFAYNHADWYVNSVLLRAKLISGLPVAFVSSLTGLTQGRFPVHASATYDRTLPDADAPRRRILITSRAQAAVIAVQDARVIDVGHNRRLGRFVRLRDVFGNTYTYGGLGEIARTYRLAGPVREGQATDRPIRRSTTDARNLIALAAGVRVRAHAATGTARGEPDATSGVVAPAVGPAPDLATLRAAAAATVARRGSGGGPAVASGAAAAVPAPPTATPETGGPGPAAAATTRPGAPEPSARTAVPADTAPVPPAAAVTGLTTEAGETVRYHPIQPVAAAADGRGQVRVLRKGALVPSGTVVGRLGEGHQGISHLSFEIRPAGQGSPRIDPAPLLDGWRLLETTAIYRAAAGDGLANGRVSAAAGQVLLLSKAVLQRRVLSDPRVHIYPCGRQDIAAGTVDRRVLATLAFLAASGLEPTVSSVRCGHGYLTASGNVSEHSSGNAVDIAAINGTPILGHQGAGSITETTVRRLLTLQGVVRPHQIISLMTIPGADNTLALPDHADHIHVGFDPQGGTEPALGAQTAAILAPGEWTTLIQRLAAIAQPRVPRAPSDASVPVPTTRTGSSR